jgi:hypothetical protein
MKRWLSNRDTCDICSTDMSPGKVEFFIDGRTVHGDWALMCPKCWALYGIEHFGTGAGQMYEGKTIEATKIKG